MLLVLKIHIQIAIVFVVHIALAPLPNVLSIVNWCWTLFDCMCTIYAQHVWRAYQLFVWLHSVYFCCVLVRVAVPSRFVFLKLSVNKFDIWCALPMIFSHLNITYIITRVITFSTLYGFCWQLSSLRKLKLLFWMRVIKRLCED